MSDTTAPAALPPSVAALAEALARVAELVGEGGIVPEGLTPDQAARLVGVSVSKLHQLNGDGLCPAPVEIGTGRCPRWLRSELLAWLRAGAPARTRWLQMRDVVLRRAG